ncbi:MAG: HipA domain-containing protein [Bryobacteraceae bacterium]
MITVRSKVQALPPGWKAPAFVQSSVDAFIGYLLLDALVGNTDRHHENWAVLRLPDGTVHLAPTFDHASSLGRNLLEEECAERLRTKDRNRTVDAFAGRALSALYHAETDKKPLSPLSAFLEAAHWSRAAAVGWLGLVEGLADEEIDIIMGNVPPECISDTAAQFAQRLISVNKRTLLGLKKEME